MRSSQPGSAPATDALSGRVKTGAEIVAEIDPPACNLKPAVMITTSTHQPTRCRRSCMAFSFIPSFSRRRLRPPAGSMTAPESADRLRPMMRDGERVLRRGLGWPPCEAWKASPDAVEPFLLEWKETAPRLRRSKAG